MTENNSDFVQEPSIGNCADIPQETEKISASSEDSEVKSIDNCTNSLEELCLSAESKDLSSSTENEKHKEVSDASALNVECEEKLHLLQDHWLKLSAFFRKVYHTILDGEKPPDENECHMDIVKELVSYDPHQLFARLETYLQEFIIEIKLRQIELSNCIHTEEGMHLFIFCLVEGYNKLMFAANTLSPILLQLEVEHLSNFDITWRGLNQHLFHKLVFAEPKIQKVLPFCISRLWKNNSDASDFNKRLVQQFLTFDDEMIKIGAKWREAETAIMKYHQENSMLDAKERMMKMNWELMKSQTRVFHEELKSSGICDDYFSESIKKIKIEAEDAEDQVCKCCYLSATQCLISSEPSLVDSLMDSKLLKSCFHDESPCLDDEMLTHLNIDDRKMYSHLHKLTAPREQLEVQQKHMMNGVASPPVSLNLDTDKREAETSILNGDQAPVESPQLQQSRQSSQAPMSAAELHRTLIRKHHQRKIMQLMNSSQQKDIQQKIQKQLQEHQALLQQQRKIDELQAHLLQQHPMHLDKEIQRKVHLKLQHRFMQKQKEVEEKIHEEIQQQLQNPEELQQFLASKMNLPQKVNQNQPNVAPCNYSKTVPSRKSNHKCSASVSSQSKNPLVNLNVSVSLSASVSSTKPTTTNAGVNVGVTHKNSTTQTTSASTAGQSVRHHPLPDVVKSASHVCSKHTDANRNTPHSHGDHYNSSDFESDEDYGSERSNSPQRHCDCCYCEVFGSAPVSRNFQETRERLRLILTKKKAKSNSAAANNDKQTAEQTTATSTNTNHHPVQQTSQNVGKVKKGEVPPSADKKVKPAVEEYKGDKSIEEILDFIEGNKIRNLKRTAKKMRRKQRQLEEEERRRKEEEAERQRQEEIRRKEEEEKRRIEEERRRQEQRSKKNKKKNSKQNQQINAVQASQQNASKNKKKQTQQVQTNDKNKSAQNQLNKNGNQKQPNNQQTKQTQQKKGKQDQFPSKQANKEKTLSEKQQSTKNNTNAQKKTQNQQKNGGKDDNSQPQMVTIKRVMQPNSSEPTVTITLRGSTPKEDKVLYTLMNGQMCQVKDEKGKKQASSAGNNANNKKNVKPNTNTANTYAVNNNCNLSNPPPTVFSKSIPFNKSCSIIGNGVNNITERMERLKMSSQSALAESTSKTHAAPGATQAELTTPTAIQINQAVNQLSSRPTFPTNFDLENIKLPPGITITKVDPASVNRKPIQAKQQPPPPPPPQAHVRQTMMSSMPSSSNVIVVDTGDKNNHYQSEEQAVNGVKKKRRRRKKDNADNMQSNMSNVPQQFGAPNGFGLPPRMGPINAGMYGNPFVNNDYRNTPQQAAAIIQMNGSMVTIRNPALHQALNGPQMDYHDSAKVTQHNDFRNPNTDENMFPPAPEEIENDDLDEYDRELEAFKRFCSQSVPAESKAKVNLNLEDIVLKKKGPVIGCS